nr:hypothetical protein Iba_chr06aCG19230 [Ipomoea batatas]
MDCLRDGRPKGGPSKWIKKGGGTQVVAYTELCPFQVNTNVPSSFFFIPQPLACSSNTNFTSLIVSSEKGTFKNPLFLILVDNVVLDSNRSILCPPSNPIMFSIFCPTSASYSALCWLSLDRNVSKESKIIHRLGASKSASSSMTVMSVGFRHLMVSRNVWRHGRYRSQFWQFTTRASSASLKDEKYC